MTGPEVYRLALAHTAEQAAALVERALGAAVARVEKNTVGASHAVYMVTLADGQECVLRVATHPEHDLALELWAAERCRRLGVPVPEVLACEKAPRGGALPYAIVRRLPGGTAHRARLTPAERTAVLEEMGSYLARIHAIRLAGFGPLEPRGDDGREGYAGRAASLWEYLCDDVEARLRRVPAQVMPSRWAAVIRDRFARSRSLVDRDTGVLVHGDYRFKNTLLDGVRVSGILDFENVVAGDPAMDLAYLYYSDGQSEADLAAILRGYGLPAPPDRQLTARLLLYRLRDALVHLWWAAGFDDAAGTAAVLERIRGFEAALDRL